MSKSGKDFGASIRNFIGGRSGSYENELIKAREKALAEMSQRAMERGANAVVGIDISEFFKLLYPKVLNI